MPNIICVSKTFPLSKLEPLINFGHYHFGENKVQEAISKWSQQKKENDKIKLHMIGKLQNNKVKDAVKLFDYIHSVDNQKLADNLSKHQKNLNKNPLHNQTGPAKRGDKNTIKEHLSLLKDENYKKIYKLLSKNILEEHEH